MPPNPIFGRSGEKLAAVKNPAFYWENTRRRTRCFSVCGMFAVLGSNALKICGAVETQQGGDFFICNGIEHQRRPAQGSCRITHRGHGMADIVLAVAIGSFPILPSLSPVDRRKPHQKGVCVQRSG